MFIFNNFPFGFCLRLVFEGGSTLTECSSCSLHMATQTILPLGGGST